MAAALLGLMLAPARAADKAPPACGNSGDPASVVQAQVDAYNAHDLTAFAACYADAVSIELLGSGEPPRKGQAALKEDYAFLGRMPEGFGVDIVQRTVNGPIVVDHERIHGLPDGRSAPDAIAVYEVRDGKILNVWFPPRK